MPGLPHCSLTTCYLSPSLIACIYGPVCAPSLCPIVCLLSLEITLTYVTLANLKIPCTNSFVSPSLGEAWTIYQNQLPILVGLVHFSLLQAPLAGSPSQLTCLLTLRCSLLLQKKQSSGLSLRTFHSAF